MPQRPRPSKPIDIYRNQFLNILAISGSLRAGSSNTSAIEALALLAPAEVLVEIYRSMGELPHFNPDLDGDDPPQMVRELRERVGKADILVVSCPEYAHGVPGSFKNLLDWLVASLEFPGKPVALIRTSSRGVHADASLREILKTMTAELVEDACVTIPVMGKDLNGPAITADPDLRPILEGVLVLLLKRS